MDLQRLLCIGIIVFFCFAQCNSQPGGGTQSQLQFHGQGKKSETLSIADPVRQAIIQNLTNAVKFVISPAAEPSEKMIQFSIALGRSPSTMFEKAMYLEFIRQIARNDPAMKDMFTTSEGSLDESAMKTYLKKRAFEYKQLRDAGKEVPIAGGVTSSLSKSSPTRSETPLNSGNTKFPVGSPTQSESQAKSFNVKLAAIRSALAASANKTLGKQKHSSVSSSSFSDMSSASASTAQNEAAAPEAKVPDAEIAMVSETLNPVPKALPGRAKPNIPNRAQGNEQFDLQNGGFLF